MIHYFFQKSRPILFGAVASVLASCAMPGPERASVEAQPKSPAVKNITSFTASLRCMDDLFAAYGKKDIVITSDGIPDQTGQIKTGTKEMMISAISKMTAKSSAFRFVDVDRRQDTVFWIQQNWIGVREGLLAPNYYIRGAITQVDAGVMNDRQSAGFSIPQFSIGVSRDQLVSVVSMDLNIGDIINRQIVSGLSSTNSIAVVKTGKGADTEGLIGKAGLFFQVSSDRSQGSHQSVRTLVELGLIEILGKLTQVPYWRCLEIESTNPEVMAQARDWYDKIEPAERVKITQVALGRKGLYRGSYDGLMNASLRQAINRYQAEYDLIADGRVNFDLYYSLLVNNLAFREDVKRETRAPEAVAASQAALSASASAQGVTLQLEPDGGKDRVFGVGENLQFAFSVSDDAYVYCYYSDHNGVVARVFPSRFQDNPKVRAGTRVDVPSKSAGYSITLEKRAADEKIACIAAQKPYGQNRPFVLDEGDLKPLSVSNLKSIVDQHVDADRFGTTVQHLSIKVR